MSNSCLSCGKPIFELIEGKTTSDEIEQFANSSSYYSYADLHAQVDGSPLVGEYCPDGCPQAEGIGNGAMCNVDFNESRKYLARKTCKIILSVESINTENYKVYVDGNVEVAGKWDLDSEGSVQIRILPGDHRIVVREKDVRKAGRIESNTIHFSVADNAEFRLVLSGNGESLELTQG